LTVAVVGAVPVAVVGAVTVAVVAVGRMVVAVKTSYWASG